MMPLLSRKPVRCLSIALMIGFFSLPVTLPFPVLIAAGLALIWTFLEAGSLAPIGLGRHRLSSTLAWGVGIFVAVSLFGEIVQPTIERLLGIKVDYSGYGALAGNAGAALSLLAYALTSAAIGEEILARGFLLHQLTGTLGSRTGARWAAIALGAILFGLAHWMQGPVGVISTGLVGAIFGWAWFRTGRNLLALILAHALTDTFGIAMLYFGRYA